jgi:hypothetical protein
MSVTMQVETKFLRLKTPVTLGSFFGDWRVCWLGGWCKHRFYYIVMVSRIAPGRSIPQGDYRASATITCGSHFATTPAEAVVLMTDFRGPLVITETFKWPKNEDFRESRSTPITGEKVCSGCPR